MLSPLTEIMPIKDFLEGYKARSNAFEAAKDILDEDEIREVLVPARKKKPVAT